MYNDDERERPSWREIDRRKDRSRFVREERPERQSKRQKAIIVNYKHKLKEAFKSGKIAEAIDKLEGDSPQKRERRENIKILRGTTDIKKFEKALRWYISQKPATIEAEIVNRALDFDRSDITISVLELLKSTNNPVEIVTLPNIKEKLKLISMTTKDIKLRSLVREILNICGE